MNKTSLKKEYSARIKAWKELNPKVAKGTRVTSDSKAEAVRIAAVGKLAGANRTLTCKRLGISHNALWRWSKLGQSHPAATVVAIPVPATPIRALKGSVEVTLPSGAKVTGITAAEAVSLLKALA